MEHSELIREQFTRQAVPFATAMLDQARTHAAGQGVTNVTWRQGDVLPLPWSDAAFTLVTARFAFHAPAAAKAAAFNRMETLRDPSHVRSLPVVEHVELFRRVGLPEPRVTHYRREG